MSNGPFMYLDATSCEIKQSTWTWKTTASNDYGLQHPHILLLPCFVLYVWGFFGRGLPGFFCQMRLIKSVLRFLGQLYFEEIWVSSTEGKTCYIYLVMRHKQGSLFFQKKNPVKLWDTYKASYALILTLVNFFVKRLLSDTILIWCLYFDVHVGIVILCTLVYIVHLL